jgi:hypothetical protein
MDRVSTPPTVLHTSVCIYYSLSHPLINSYAYMAWMAFGWNGWLSTYREFLERYPYCGRQVWAFLLMDYIGPHRGHIRLLDHEQR